MNPSSHGWIDKYIFILEKRHTAFPFSITNSFYNALREVGFIYGFSIGTVVDLELKNVKLTEEEIGKINLLHALLNNYFQYHENSSYPEAIDNLLLFYAKLTKDKPSFFRKISFSTSKIKGLELLLSHRVEKNKTLEKYNFERIMTQALLFVDVLAYIYFLKGGKKVDKYINELEILILQVSYLALKSKKQQTAYDILLIELFQASEQYAGKGSRQKTTTIENLDFNLLSTKTEKQYIMDLCCLAVWNDLQVDESEKQFLDSLAKKLQLALQSSEGSLDFLQDFAQNHTKNIHLFHYKHPVKQFYKQSSKTVQILIMRNKNRLLKEISHNKELLVLLGKSTYSDLNSEEKVKVKDQLLEVCKTIPSLTIFLLPGGSLLLPLLVKFIPQLLPGAFDDNKIPKKKKI